MAAIDERIAYPHDYKQVIEAEVAIEILTTAKARLYARIYQIEDTDPSEASRLQEKATELQRLRDSIRITDDAAQLRHCSAHGLRKPAAVALAEKGTTAPGLCAIFGWSKLETAAIYIGEANKSKTTSNAFQRLEKCRNRESVSLPGKSAPSAWFKAVQNWNGTTETDIFPSGDCCTEKSISFEAFVLPMVAEIEPLHFNVRLS